MCAAGVGVCRRNQQPREREEDRRVSLLQAAAVANQAAKLPFPRATAPASRGAAAAGRSRDVTGAVRSHPAWPRSSDSSGADAVHNDQLQRATDAERDRLPGLRPNFSCAACTTWLAASMSADRGGTEKGKVRHGRVPDALAASRTVGHRLRVGGSGLPPAEVLSAHQSELAEGQQLRAGATGGQGHGRPDGRGGQIGGGVDGQ
jgi:hypothetical protein